MNLWWTIQVIGLSRVELGWQDVGYDVVWRWRRRVHIRWLCAVLNSAKILGTYTHVAPYTSAPSSTHIHVWLRTYQPPVLHTTHVWLYIISLQFYTYTRVAVYNQPYFLLIYSCGCI